MTTNNRYPTLSEQYPNEYAKLAKIRDRLEAEDNTPSVIVTRTDKGARGRATEICSAYRLATYEYEQELDRYKNGERKTAPKKPTLRDRVNSQGKSDYTVHVNGKTALNVEIKSGSGAISYGDKKPFYGSSAVLYCVNPTIEVISEDENLMLITVDFNAYEWFMVDAKAFADFLLSNPSLTKLSKNGFQRNIQTLWNVSKNKPHSAGLYKTVMDWLEHNQIDDDYDLIGKLLGWA